MLLHVPVSYFLRHLACLKNGCDAIPQMGDAWIFGSRKSLIYLWISSQSA
jgi:hypothetical protein